MTPEELQSGSALIGEERKGKEILLAATSTRDELAEAISALRDRDVTNPERFSHLGAGTLWDTVNWYDHERRFRQIGAGVLFRQLQAGGKPGWRPSPAKTTDTGSRSREYAAQIADWLNEHFPEYKQASGNPHPGAITALIRLHHQHGKTGVTKAEHGAEIRDSVRAFNEKWGWS